MGLMLLLFKRVMGCWIRGVLRLGIGGILGLPLLILLQFMLNLERRGGFRILRGIFKGLLRSRDRLLRGKRRGRDNLRDKELQNYSGRNSVRNKKNS